MIEYIFNGKEPLKSEMLELMAIVLNIFFLYIVYGIFATFYIELGIKNPVLSSCYCIGYLHIYTF